MTADLTEMQEELDMEMWLDDQAVDYNITPGNSGEQINLKQCPRCGGSDWKVFLNRETGLGNCFHGSCVGERGFNKINFIKLTLGVTFVEAKNHVEEFLKQQGWRPPKQRSEYVAPEVTEIKIPESIALPMNGRNLTYLAKRNISNETVAHFGLRYVRKGAYFFTKPDGKRGWQNYDGRVFIPIYDLTGKLVTFQGRDILNVSDRKYLFPPQLPGTGRYLYNGHAVIGCEEICICEGAFDVFAAHQAFREDLITANVGAVGSFGKTFSHGSATGDDQIGALNRLKLKGLKRVTMMWDSEPKTLLSAIDAAQVIKQMTGLPVSLAVLPDGCDPNEVSSEVVRDAYRRAQPLTLAYTIKMKTALSRKAAR